MMDAPIQRSAMPIPSTRTKKHEHRKKGIKKGDIKKGLQNQLQPSLGMVMG
jgi:hypothetical protein